MYKYKYPYMIGRSAQSGVVFQSCLWMKCTLVQALRLCTGRTAYRGNRGIHVALTFLDDGTRWG